jgi:hypothetical protein
MSDQDLNVSAELEAAASSREVAAKDETEFALFEERRNIGILNVKTGKVRTRRRDGLIDQPRVNNPRKRAFKHSLPFKVPGDDKVDLLPGLTVISGATAVGKSSILRDLAPQVKRILAVEAPDTIGELEGKDALPMYDSVDAAIMAGAYVALRSKTLIAIDSFRGPLFEINGAAGAKGVIMPFFTALTRVSNSLAKHGITMLATVNPMDDDPEYVRSFLSKVSSAVPCFIDLQAVDWRTATYSGTIQNRENRNPIPFTFGRGAVFEEATEVRFTPPAPEQILSNLAGVQLNKLEETL